MLDSGNLTAANVHQWITLINGLLGIIIYLGFARYMGVKMSKKVKVGVNEEGEKVLDLEAIVAGTNINIEDVAFYKLYEESEGSLVLLLFDKDKKQLKVEDEK